MLVNSETIKSFAKMSGVKSILQVPTPENALKKINFNTISINTKRLEKLEQDVFQNSKIGKLQIVGKVRLKSRISGEFVNVDVARAQLSGESNRVVLRLVHNEEDLIDVLLKEPDSSFKQYGIQINNIQKEPAGEDFIGVAKMMDVLAAKESLQTYHKGKVVLKTGTMAPFESAEPLHWNRGYKRIDYFTSFNSFKKKIYDTEMGNLFNKYKKAREDGFGIEKAKLDIASESLPSVVMSLPDEVVASNVKSAKKIRYY